MIGHDSSCFITFVLRKGRRCGVVSFAFPLTHTRLRSKEGLDSARLETSDLFPSPARAPHVRTAISLTARRGCLVQGARLLALVGPLFEDVSQDKELRGATGWQLAAQRHTDGSQGCRTQSMQGRIAHATPDALWRLTTGPGTRE